MKRSVTFDDEGWVNGIDVGSIGALHVASENDPPPPPHGPVGFARSGRKRERKIGGRRPGTWPSVPRFDIPPR